MPALLRRMQHRDLTCSQTLHRMDTPTTPRTRGCYARSSPITPRVRMMKPRASIHETDDDGNAVERFVENDGPARDVMAEHAAGTQT